MDKRKKKSQQKKDAKRKKKKKTNKFKKHAILFSKLCKTAKCNNQSILKLDAEPTQRRRALVRWLKRLNDTHIYRKRRKREYTIYWQAYGEP